jgi:hypothetical protein
MFFKELSYQNVKQGLRCGTSWLVPSVTALTMITDLNGEGKVGCHNGLWISLASFVGHP